MVLAKSGDGKGDEPQSVGSRLTCWLRSPRRARVVVKERVGQVVGWYGEIIGGEGIRGGGGKLEVNHVNLKGHVRLTSFLLSTRQRLLFRHE